MAVTARELWRSGAAFAVQHPERRFDSGVWRVVAANSDEEFEGGDARDRSDEEEDEQGFPKGSKVQPRTVPCKYRGISLIRNTPPL